MASKIIQTHLYATASLISPNTQKNAIYTGFTTLILRRGGRLVWVPYAGENLRTRAIPSQRTTLQGEFVEIGKKMVLTNYSRIWDAVAQFTGIEIGKSLHGKYCPVLRGCMHVKGALPIPTWLKLGHRPQIDWPPSLTQYMVGKCTKGEEIFFRLF